MNPDRFLGPYKEIAQELFTGVEHLPLVCPNGHVDPTLLADSEARFPDPVELFLRADHYLLRMLYSQGVALEPFFSESDPRELWRVFAQHFHLFWGTPSAIWLEHQWEELFDIREELNADTADSIYDALSEKLNQPDFSPRALFEKFRIEVLCTTDAATDSLEQHESILDDDWEGRVLPTFRPDKLLAFRQPNWNDHLLTLQRQVSPDVFVWKGFLAGLQERREFFRSLGCVATEHGCLNPYTEYLSEQKASRLFDRALRRNLDLSEAQALHGHLLIEMAQMSCEDGLVMQLHSGSYRDHNRALFERFGPDKGADIPVRVDFTRGLEALLNTHGNHPNFRLVLFTLDESTYSRELAPLAGHYPSIRLGSPWWFHDSLNGMLRYFDQVMETAGVFNTAGFNDNTRAFCSIPARHDLWRRVSCRWLSGLVADGVLNLERASRLAAELAVGRARATYNLL